MPSRRAGQKVERLNADTRLRTPRSLDATVVRSERAATLTLSQQPKPSWISSLTFIQRCSDLVAFLLVAATLSIYSWTVYTQQQWAQEYRKLETLQRHERQLTTANEVMKDQLAQQAESPATGLVTPTQANTIFLPPAPQRQVSVTPAPTTDQEPGATSPLGY